VSGRYSRDRSCLLRCSLLLKARLQNWHLYFLSGASEAFLEAGADVVGDGMTATLAPGILADSRARCLYLGGVTRPILRCFLVDGDGSNADGAGKAVLSLAER
jgi:hypothetical protein